MMLSNETPYTSPLTNTCTPWSIQFQQLITARLQNWHEKKKINVNYYTNLFM